MKFLQNHKYTGQILKTAAIVLLLTAAGFSQAYAAKKNNWPEKTKKEFMFECQEYNAMAGITGKKSEAVCSCSMDKVFFAYPNPKTYEHELLPRDFLKLSREECAKNKK